MSYIDKIQVDGVEYDLEAPQIYDDQERVIGTWFGKPLYRKTLSVGTYSSTRTEVAYPTTVSDIDKCINLNCQYWFWSVYVSGSSFYNSKNGEGHYAFYQKASNSITFYSTWTCEDLHITIEYTKTTD